MEPKVEVAMAVPDEEYEKLCNQVRVSGRRGYICYDKNGILHRFYFEKRQLKAEKRYDGKKDLFEVLSMSEAMKKKKEMEENNPFRKHIISKMKEENPEWSEEDIQAKVDIVMEANESIKRLIATGIDPQVAHKIISGVLHSQEIQEHIVKELDKPK